MTNMKNLMSKLEDITEGVGKFVATLSRIEQLVKRNDYTSALKLGAKLLGNKKLEKTFTLIGELHDLDGSLDRNLEIYRMEKSKELDAIAKRNLSKDDYRLFNRSF